MTIVAALFFVCSATARERWLFLGDSITQAGHYVDYVETWFLLNEEDAPEILGLGLSSETISGLSEPDHPYPRPYVHDRLDKVLERVKPDLVFACYGMNCAIYHPFSKERFNAYQRGVRKLVRKVQKAGAEVILLTPPPYAGRVKPKPGPSEGEPYGYKTPSPDYNEVLGRYADWILTWQGKKGVRAYSVREGIEAYMEKCYPKEPVHPNAFGHYLMAESLLEALGKESGSELLDTGVSTRDEDARWTELYQLVSQQRKAYDMALMNDIGHGNPGVMKRVKYSLAEGEAKAAELEKEIRALLDE
ncbi:GDSL-type esterase/lipase family protein [Pelagicoccus mobilis]|uniref:GDSL-type esterase/lipase family protein n=1 Tax=Pelagicoccus mobilis TaxID=415221 RepID=UPI003670B275